MVCALLRGGSLVENPKDRKITENELNLFKKAYFKVADNNAYYFAEDQFDTAKNNAVLKIHDLLELSTDWLDNVLNFNIKAAPGYRGFGNGVLKYPNTFSAYNAASNTQLLSPIKGVLRSGTAEQFAMISREYTKIAVITNGAFTQLTKNSRTGNFELDFEIPAGISTLEIYGSKDGRQYTGLVQYNVVQGE